MKIKIFHYELKPRGTGSPRHGALLRVESNAGVGFADLHPWTELGDLSLVEQLSGLRSGRLTALTRNSLRFARLDAEARVRGASLFEGLKIPPSHLLITDLEAHVGEPGFDRIKVKVGRDPEKEVPLLRKLAEEVGLEARFRLDFNALLEPNELDIWLKKAQKVLDRVDWIEDPLKWNPSEWKALRKNWGVKLAADREGDGIAPEALQEVADLRVLKPAVLGEDPAVWGCFPLVFTSYLDHPVGQLFAAYEAAKAKAQGANVQTCGLISHRVYQLNPFSEQLKSEGPLLCPVEGAGIGFEDLLESLAWESLP